MGVIGVGAMACLLLLWLFLFIPRRRRRVAEGAYVAESSGVAARSRRPASAGDGEHVLRGWPQADDRQQRRV